MTADHTRLAFFVAQLADLPKYPGDLAAEDKLNVIIDQAQELTLQNAINIEEI